VRVRIYIEGGGDTDLDRSRCREGFTKLFQRMGYIGRMPHVIACGPRGKTHDRFVTAHENIEADVFVAMLVDSENPMEGGVTEWKHLKRRDGWDMPQGAIDDQVLLMITCMETWFVADRPTLREHYKSKLQEKGLPDLHELELRNRQDVQEKLEHATRNCSNAYKKGKRSFELLAKLNPEELEKHLPGFQRVKRILNEKL